MIMDFQHILSLSKSLQASMLDTLELLVHYESPSQHKDKLDVLAAVLSGRFQAVGAQSEILTSAKRGHHIRAVVAPSQAEANVKPVLILGHYDTVWPVGTIADRPFRIEDGFAYGPGIFDMKGGLVIIEYALRLIKLMNLPLPRPVVVLLNSDEEIGSPDSRKLIKQHARLSEYVLVMEPALPGGELKTARKGVGAFTVAVTGRAAHAGAEPENGANAIVELARQILHIQNLEDQAKGTTLNVGTISGGMRSNVVPAHAQARVDCRAWTAQEAQRVEKALKQLEPFNAETALKVRGGFGRPPMERLPGTVALFERVANIGKHLGLTLSEGSTGGASDGNFTAALGIPTLDGLGVKGSGAHAIHEQVEITSLPERTALLAAVLCCVQ